MGKISMFCKFACFAMLLSWLAAGAKAQSLADVWSGRARFALDNRFTFGANFGMHFISTWGEGGTLYSYYVGRDSSGQDTATINLALSRDGIRFENQGVVIPRGPNSWDNRITSFPGVWKLQPGRWAIVYEGAGFSQSDPGDIGLALAPDGIHFTKDDNPIMRHAKRLPNDPSLDLSWERNNIGTPSLWVENGTRYLFYHGFGKSWERGSPDDCQVGVAIGTDLRNMRRYEGNPILKTGAHGTWDSGSIGRRSIRKENGWYYMVYEGSTDQPYGQAKWSSGLARSRDLLTWEKFAGNPILPQTTSGFGFDGSEWVQTPDGKLHIYYRNGSTCRATLVWR